MKNIFFFCLALSLTACFTACKGDKGDPGPAGVAGPKGDTGSAGPGSVKGVKYTVSASDWAYEAPSWTAARANTAITPNILDKGGVFVYWEKSAGVWVALPFTHYPTDWYTSTLHAEYYAGGVKFFITDSDLSEPRTPAAHTFKVLVVAGDQRVRNDDMDWTDYAKVLERFDVEFESE